jgi:CyaY protein
MTQAQVLKLSDIEYLNHAEAALASLERNCDRLNDNTDTDIDNQRTGGMVTMTFTNKSQIIINLQKPLQEIWLAAKAGGFHYKFDMTSQTWRDTKQATELFADVSRYASEQSGATLTFNF